MKAKLYDRIQTLSEIQAHFGRRIVPPGTVGTVVECYEHPRESYSVDLTLPNSTQEGGVEYENLILNPEQFKVMGETPEESNLESLFGGTHYEVPQVVLDGAAVPQPDPKPPELTA
ncbi:DUF4926 domain-containing protein [Lyngbya sp. CCY1209]|jgi:hypothetical protein|uniref:DUF4926 domain-containing protein n=1 Tax=Lyngbya sp. CCY1209 TaxID=2886103 RepID=UPI002D2143F1|nr:DUF4926 domain-containing protein [Lyngbya sp. CCY1209]MEB3884406.1 DUF4926 domain-containing protein [Lyngbya sp. CCY1209]